MTLERLKSTEIAKTRSQERRVKTKVVSKRLHLK